MTFAALNVATFGRRWAVKAGNSVLRTFRTETEARASLAANRNLYAYWAGSVSVSVENTTPRRITA